MCCVCKDQGETTYAVKWCQDCNEALCTKCLNLHDQYPKFRNHATTSLANSLKSDTAAKCTEHSDEDLKLFCNDCDVIICHLCCSVNHRKCDSVVTIVEACPLMKRALSMKAIDLRVRLAKRQSVIPEKNRQLERLMESSEEAQEQLETSCDDFIRNFQAIKSSLLNRIVQQTDAAARTFTQDIVDTETMCTSILKDCCLIEQGAESRSVSNIYGLYKQFCYTNCLTDAGDVDEIEEKPKVIEIKYINNIDEVTQSLKQKYIGLTWNVFEKPKVSGGEKDRSDTASIGSLDDSEMKKNKKKKKKKSKPSFVGNPIHSLNVEVATFVTQLHEMAITVDGDGTEESVIADMIIVPNTDSCTIVVADKQNKRVVTFNQETNKMEFLPCLKSPVSLTRVSNTEAAVLLQGDLIYLLQIHPALGLLSKITTEPLYTDICHLESLRFAASVSSSNVIDVIDCSGKVLKQIANAKLSKSVLIYKAPLPGQFLVSDPESRSVTKLTTNNKELFRYHPANNHHMQKNHGLGTDRSGNVYVVDRGRSKVIKLSSDLRYMQDILKVKDATHVLSHIQIDDQNRMYLTYRDREVHVFQM